MVSIITNKYYPPYTACGTTFESRYETFESRYETFIDNPVQIFTRKKCIELANAGFYYIGPDDYVKCFCCNRIFKDFEFHDDPWVCHAKDSSTCKHVLDNKGNQFISSALRAFYMMRKKKQPSTLTYVICQLAFVAIAWIPVFTYKGINK